MGDACVTSREHRDDLIGRRSGSRLPGPPRTHKRNNTMKRFFPLLAALLLAGAACGDDEASSACEARDELESSVEALRDIDVLDDGLDALRADLDAVGEDLATFRTEAGDELEPQTDAVRGPIDQIRSTLDSGGTPAEIAASIGTGLSDLATSWNELAEAAQGLCD
jgi:hypothetical protein